MTKIDVDVDWKRGRSPKWMIARLAGFEAALDSELEAAMEDAVLWVEADAKRKAPVDTGTLRASIASIVEKDVQNKVRGFVGTNVEYAPFQEFGTQYMGAQPYLRPAIEKNRDRIKKRFLEAVEDAADTAF